MAVSVKGKKIKELREEKGRIAAAMQAHLDANEDGWNDEHEATHAEMMGDISTLTSTISRREQVDLHIRGDLNSSNSLPSEHPLEAPNGMSEATFRQIAIRNYERDANTGRGRYSQAAAGERGTAAYEGTFSKFLKEGASGITYDQRAQLQSDDAKAAGYLTVSEQFAANLLKEVDDLLFIRRYATVHTVRQAASLGIRKRTNRLSSASWGSELSTPILDTSLKFGKKALTPHYLTQGIAVSRDLIRRSVMSVDQVVREELARDAAELQETAFMFGDGAEKPLGLFFASLDGISTARDFVCGTSTAITADGLLDVKYSLKAQYRDGTMGALRWLLSREGVKQCAKLKTSDNQYIWQPGLQAGEPDRLLNLPLDESEKVPSTFTTGQYVGGLFNYRYYEIADALDMDMQILDQSPYAEQNLIAYINRQKTDGMPTLEEAFSRMKLA